MERLGWRVYPDHDTRLWKIAEPDGAVYKIGYVEESFAWNFAVRQFIESLPE